MQFYYSTFFGHTLVVAFHNLGEVQNPATGQWTNSKIECANPLLCAYICLTGDVFGLPNRILYSNALIYAIRNLKYMSISKGAKSLSICWDLIRFGCWKSDLNQTLVFNWLNAWNPFICSKLNWCLTVSSSVGSVGKANILIFGKCIQNAVFRPIESFGFEIHPKSRTEDKSKAWKRHNWIGTVDLLLSVGNSFAVATYSCSNNKINVVHNWKADAEKEMPDRM